MAEQNDGQTAAEPTGEAKTETNEQGLKNHDVKAHPLFQKLASESAEMRKKLEALESKERDLEMKRAEAEKDYQTASKLQIEKALSDARKQWESETATRDTINEARLQLVKGGFKNEAFIKGLLADFDPSKTSAEEFAKAAIGNKENRAFLDSVGSRANPDMLPSAASDFRKLTPEQIKQLQSSAKPEDRAKAREVLLEEWAAKNDG